MQYLALIYADEEQWSALLPEEKEAMYDGYRAVASAATEAGVMTGGNELAPTSDATTVRVRGDETVVTDGPYAEVKEALGGYFLLECESMNEALDWAARAEGGLELLDAIEGLDDYHLLHAARADLMRRRGRRDEAAASYRRALELTANEAEARYLERRLAEVS